MNNRVVIKGHLEQGTTERKSNVFVRTLESFSNSFLSTFKRFHKACARWQLKGIEKSIADCDKSIEHAKNNPSYHVWLDQCYVKAHLLAQKDELEAFIGATN